MLLLFYAIWLCYETFNLILEVVAHLLIEETTFFVALAHSPQTPGAAGIIRIHAIVIVFRVLRSPPAMRVHHFNMALPFHFRNAGGASMLRSGIGSQRSHIGSNASRRFGSSRLYGSRKGRREF